MMECLVGAVQLELIAGIALAQHAKYVNLVYQSVMWHYYVQQV